MPTYEYACAVCGPFTAVQKLAAFDRPANCPACGQECARSFGVPDFLQPRAGRVARSTAAAREEDSYPRMRHGGTGCACCPV